MDGEKKDRKHYWICDVCSKEFKNESEAIEHEKTCTSFKESEKEEKRVNLANWSRKLKNTDEGTTIEETVSIDEAVGYGFNMFKGIAKYIIFIIILNGIGFVLFAVSVSEREEVLLLFGILFIIAGIILNIALSIGVLYKLWVDILARSRK
tara:strand:+ start:40 stop:492 length:453 start_codon:yes stop_codon:yes gene_type:complete